MLTDKKAQMWFTDFVLAVFIFMFTLISFYLYLNNVTKPDEVSIDSVISEAQALSSALVGAGFPSGWNAANVEVIGLTNNDLTINRSKMVSFQSLSYDKSKSLFGTVNDYFIYFESANRSTISVEGVCGIGNPTFNATFNTTTAYYFDSEAVASLRTYMAAKLDADLYSAQIGYDDMAVLKANSNNYDVIVFENALFTSADLITHQTDLETFVNNGKTIIILGEFVTTNGEEALGAEFYKKGTQTIIDRNTTVATKEASFDMEHGESIVYSVANYVQNASGASDIVVMQKFLDDNRTASSYWSYGNGSMLFLSDATGNNTNLNFDEVVQRAIPSWGEYKCNQIDIDTISYKNLVRIDRLLIHNLKPVKVVIYAWQ